MAPVGGPAAKKVMVIGLDCAEPSLLEAWRTELPALSSLMERGVHGRLTR
jgi:predicted AlkP superfamily phosphohydrolase/phosphomutase